MPDSPAAPAVPALSRPDAQPTLADLTTLRVGGDVDTYVETSTEAELIDVIRSADDAGEPLLVLGGGSNLLVADEGFGGVVVKDVRTGLRVESEDTCGGASMSGPAGHAWDDVVVQAVDAGWVGIEALSGIPGTLGAAPVQNVGAYGQEVAGVISTVRVWDRGENRVRTFANGELGFGYRTSRLKRSMHLGLAGYAGSSDAETDPRAPWYPSPRYVVLDVSMQLRLGTLSAPVAYAELARRLGVDVGERAPSADVRAAVLELRGGKGMLLDPAVEGGRLVGEPDHDRWSAGSFFTNPVVPAAVADELPEGAPRFEVRSPRPAVSTGPSLGAVDPTLVKTSAAWLIEHAGFGKGFGVAGEASPARLSTRHPLALTNRGGATAADLVALARAVRDGVRERFGIELEPEPVLVGVSL
ncbi:UDP-N-acetylmuramate dehydrogenase [Luteimicrobium xylanilyticum]|uniref:UDP-N-acetylenolpyruvoylglucosamine reductase n=1 Tax=Luteimicrobium xylanilyticum TaxID=1133546 RepID=A0A5P9Q8A7_9MICO|nr:UDP-N-acetylmuramate dehydrogenase [Luteimicrobium xylanilyticum]QFU97292.1 UDP-N-acetylmuramate dehydrogenase [Luteimicrobium xylanilyticum]